MIRIKRLDKYFNKGKQNQIHVINDVSLELPDKGMVAIFGKSGCGKTTLLNVIGGLDKYGSGSVMIENQDIANDPDLIRNKYIGYVFQNYNLDLSKSCFDNVADALRLCGVTDREVIEKRVFAALRNVGMEKYQKRNPDTLSGGQQQRIAIARAIVKNPKIILADEPTGNLDEANTVMIMDLLRAIAKDHLVLLVTHEANLVDYYCDTVIELSDGKVVNIKNNDLVGGFSAKDKNTIYLGEFEKKTDKNENTEIEYYGDAPAQPLKMRIVNNGGKIYVRFDSDKIHVLDESAEIKLVEGVFEEKKEADGASKNVNMSDLPPISGTKFGNLFTLKSSIISGYRFNFKQVKRGKKTLRNCLCLLASVLVLMMSVFGTSISDIIDARSMYNHNVFYVYTKDFAVSEKLISAIDNEDTGIDQVRLTSGYPYGDDTIKFMTGFFETFSSLWYDESFTANAVYLDITLAKDLPLAEGKNSDLSREEIIITTAVADKLLERSSLGYIKEYKDLLGLISNSVSVDGKNIRIAGIVESDETAVYLNEVAMAKYVLQYMGLSVVCDTDRGMDVAPGNTVLLITYAQDNVKYPAKNGKVTIHGRTLNVENVYRGGVMYDEWLGDQGKEKYDAGKYFEDVIAKEYPTLAQGTREYEEKHTELMNLRYCEWLDYYYADRNEYFEYQLLISPDNFDIWLAVEKDADLNAVMNYCSQELGFAEKYRQVYGKTPTFDELMSSYEKLLDKINSETKENYLKYEEEFYMRQYQSFDNVYVVDESDYVAFSRQVGDTDDTANSFYDYGYYAKEVIVYDEYYYSDGMDVYSVIHSNDPKKTAEWLNAEFADLETPYPEYMQAILTPDDIFDELIMSSMVEIISNVFSMAIITCLLILCMYFIMRSSLMNRIKEVGINRAIGVSKKNLVFKFFIEATVLATLTVFIGYLLTSAFITACLGISPLVSSIFFYPWWYALLLLAVLYLMSVVCGILPILGLLRKTPSEILAKYDI